VTDDTPISMAKKARLASEVTLTYVRARRALRRTTLPETLAALRAAGARAPEHGRSFADGLWLAGAVVKTLRALPVDDRCLMQAIVLSGLLARRDMPAVFVLGVRPGESFAAHAWVELDGRALLPPYESEFERLAEL
jgi:hypothetical protein